jgi:hypothetical protein
LLTNWSSDKDINNNLLWGLNKKEQFGITELNNNCFTMYAGDGNYIYNSISINHNLISWNQSIKIQTQNFTYPLGWGRPIMFTDPTIIQMCKGLINY